MNSHYIDVEFYNQLFKKNIIRVVRVRASIFQFYPHYKAMVHAKQSIHQNLVYVTIKNHSQSIINIQ